MWISVRSANRSGAVAERGVLVERIADGDHHVGLEERLPRRGMAAVAEHADRQRMAFRDDALAVERGEQRQLEALDQPPHLRAGAAADRAEANQRHDLLVLGKGIGEIVGDLGDARRIGQNRLHLETEVAVVGHLDAVVREVFRDVDVHRAGPPLEGEVHRLLQHVARVGDIGRAASDFLVVAANIACESGVRLTPDVSLSEPLPRHSSDA